MTYIYDILLNFNDVFYEFYEWEKDDQIYHIKKIPLFKIDSKVLENIFIKKIKLNNNLCNLINNKTELYGNKNGRYIRYCCLLTDGYKVIGIQINNNLEIEKISDLLLDEAMDTINISSRLNITSLEYTIIGNRKINYFLTKKEVMIKKYLKDELKKIYKNNERLKLEYLYFEYFNKNNNNFDDAYKELNKTLNNNITDKHLNLYNILHLNEECLNIQIR